MQRLFCGIDIGSTNLKVVLADVQGRSRWVKAVPAPRSHDGVGPATDAELLLRQLEDLIIEGWHAVAAGAPLRAIAAAGIGEDGVGVRGDLSPTCLAIPWFDRRAAREVDGLRPYYPEFRFDFYNSACKWRWLAASRPGDLANAEAWVTLVDYPGSVWCGTAFMSETLAGRTGCFEVRERRWLPELLAYCSAPPRPRMLRAGTIAGTMRPGRLREAGAASADTVIVAGGHDHPTATSAIMRLAPQARIDSLGTANAIYAETDGPVTGANSHGFDICVPALSGPGVGLLAPVLFAEALRQAFGGEARVRAMLATPDLGGGSDDGKRFRSLLHDMTLQARSFLAALDAMGVAHGPLFATGGWARSEALMKLRAQVFGEAITVVDEPELVGLGAALVAIDAVTSQRTSFTPSQALRTVHPD